ncbi:MAG: hypothetical protein ABL904_26390, partial [Hyphomicrobiaceae bacterium]
MLAKDAGRLPDGGAVAIRPSWYPGDRACARQVPSNQQADPGGKMSICHRLLISLLSLMLMTIGARA